MSEKIYKVSNHSLYYLTHHINEIIKLSSFIQEYFCFKGSSLKSEIISDGVYRELNGHYDEIIKILKVISNDGKFYPPEIIHESCNTCRNLLEDNTCEYYCLPIEEIENCTEWIWEGSSD